MASGCPGLLLAHLTGHLTATLARLRLLHPLTRSHLARANIGIHDIERYKEHVRHENEIAVNRRSR